MRNKRQIRMGDEIVELLHVNVVLTVLAGR